MPCVIDQLDTLGPDRCAVMDTQQASDYCRELAESHYENFTVVSWFLPKSLRADFRHVYAFCRWADDLGDEVGDRQRSLELLDWWSSEIERCYAGSPRHPVFVALRQTIDRHDIPRRPFDDLVSAFKQDQTVTRYDSWEQVVDYCTRSADPVGRLVLYLCGYRDERRQQLSDMTCTALQLTNFWQDVRRDVLERDRVYIPKDVAAAHGLSVEQMVKLIRHDASCEAGPTCRACPTESVAMSAIKPAYTQTLKDLCDRTRPLFDEGKALWPLVDRRVRRDIKLFTRGGEAVLGLIERQRYDTLTHRPSLSKARKAALMLRALATGWFGGRGGHNCPSTDAPATSHHPVGDALR